jgi:hypothetical protein
MKLGLKHSLPVMALVFITFSSYGQETAPATTSIIPKWVSEKGFWVVERKPAAERTIYFYNNESVQVYKETITGKFNLKKRKTLRYIKKILETAVIAWEQNQPFSENKNFFAAGGSSK